MGVSETKLAGLLIACLIFLNCTGEGNSLLTKSDIAISGNIFGVTGETTIQKGGANLVLSDDSTFVFSTKGTGDYHITVNAPNRCQVFNGVGNALSQVSDITISCLRFGQFLNENLETNRDVSTFYTFPDASYIPAFIATDGTYLYVSERSRDSIYRIDIATGTMSLFVGTGAASTTSTDGVGTAASFYDPRGLVINDNDLYVSDSGSEVLRRVNLTTRQVTTLSPLGFVPFKPAGLTTDGENIFIASNDNTDGQIVRYNIAENRASVYRDTSVIPDTDIGPVGDVAKTKNYLYYIGKDTDHLQRLDSVGNRRQFPIPQIQQAAALATDGKKVYITDNGGAIFRFTPKNEKMITFVGEPIVTGFTDANGSNARFNNTQGMVSHGQTLYVVDRGNRAIRKIQ